MDGGKDELNAEDGKSIKVLTVFLFDKKRKLIREKFHNISSFSEFSYRQVRETKPILITTQIN